MNRILIVDDEKTICNALKFAFNDNISYEAQAVDNIIDFNKIIQIYKPDIILLDLNFGEISGLDVLDSIKNIYPDVIVIMMTAYGTIETAIQAMKRGALDYISKPLNLKELKTLISNTAKFSKIQKRVMKVSENYDTDKIIMIGQSASSKKVTDIIEKIKDKNVNVLIQGESGTGKELVAKSIHYCGIRKDKPFVAINCGALPENLVESELFGYEKGAFTGADSYKKGKFELAQGGTLFLDEIGELSLINQVKLLRVLQEQVVQPLGNAKPINIDVRIIAATNKNLSHEVKSGNFRSDLFFRLNVVQIKIPSLNERKEDIQILSEYFLDIANKKYNINIKGITEDAMQMLTEHYYSGNIRELENIINSTAVLCDEEYISAENLMLYDLDNELINQNNGNSTITIEIGSKMADVEQSVITSTIKLVNGNKSKAAKILGISERSIHYKTKNYDTNK